MKKKSIFVLIFSLFLFMACSDNDEQECIDYEEIANVTSVQAPETATVNETVEVTVNFQVNNACGNFAQFDETVTETTRTIAVEAVYEGCACAQVITDRTTTYTFTPQTVGQHVLRFNSDGNDFVETTITVEEAASEE